jgi:hypothetical protein
LLCREKTRRGQERWRRMACWSISPWMMPHLRQNPCSKGADGGIVSWPEGALSDRVGGLPNKRRAVPRRDLAIMGRLKGQQRGRRFRLVETRDQNLSKRQSLGVRSSLPCSLRIRPPSYRRGQAGSRTQGLRSHQMPLSPTGWIHSRLLDSLPLSQPTFSPG